MLEGHILITQEGAEIARISRDERDNVVRAFYEMYFNAMSNGDKFYMLNEAYTHQYSYGECYPSFLSLSWDEFRNTPSLEGISFNTYNCIADSLQNLPICIADERHFTSLKIPRAEGGFKYSESDTDYLHNTFQWLLWRKRHLTVHPEDIVWDSHPFLPNQEVIRTIIEQEIYSHFTKENVLNYLSKPEYHQFEDISKPCKMNALILLFHKEVMKLYPSGGEKQGYSHKVGGNICESNYYQFEQRLSSAEQQSCGAQRYIYSVLKQGRKQYISLDVEKGMFEFYDEYGKHIGEYHYDGTRNTEAKPSHNLRTIR